MILIEAPTIMGHLEKTMEKQLNEHEMRGALFPDAIYVNSVR